MKKLNRYVFDIYILNIHHNGIDTLPIGYDFYETENSEFPKITDILEYLKNTYFKERSYYDMQIVEHPMCEHAVFKVYPKVLQFAGLKYMMVNNVRKIKNNSKIL